jgi:hypothetical protein
VPFKPLVSSDLALETPFWIWTNVKAMAYDKTTESTHKVGNMVNFYVRTIHQTSFETGYHKEELLEDAMLPSFPVISLY